MNKFPASVVESQNSTGQAGGGGAEGSGAREVEDRLATR